MTIIRTLRLAALVAAAGCSHAPSPQAQAGSASSAVHIDSISPSTIDLRGGGIAELRVHGKGFDKDTNRIMIGPMTVDAVGSTKQGSEIRLMLPDRIPSKSEAPPQLWPSGTFDVTVQNGKGTSNSATVTVRGS